MRNRIGGGGTLKFLAILTLRNEAAFLLEWLAHHRAVGFTDFLVFSNDCEDGTDAMLDRLEEMGQLVHLRNDGPHDRRGIQFGALKAAGRHPLVARADWLMVLDIDEFVNIHTGEHTLPALLQALPQASAITLTWRLFGNSGVERYEDRPVSEVFTACAPEVIHWPWRAAMFKTLYRNDGIYRKPGVHRPRSPDKARLDQARWFDCAGRALGRDFLTRRIYSDYGRPLYRLAQLNHYALGAMESFVLKVDRGRVNRSGRMGLDYWVERNFAAAQDDSIRRIAPRSAPLLHELKADRELARLHREGVAWRHARFEQLMRQEEYRDLYTRLLMAPPSRPLTPEQAARLTGYALEARKHPPSGE